MTKDTITLYRLLAQSLTYPNQNFVADLTTAVGKINLELFDDEKLPLREFVRELGALTQIPLDQIQGEYTRLFINAYPHVPCPPYESAYREGELMGDAAAQVAEEYRAWGLVVEDEQVDHVGAELEFIAFLLTLDTLEAHLVAESFTRDHLAQWLPQWSMDLIRESRLEFYRQVGKLCAVLIQKEGMLV